GIYLQYRVNQKSLLSVAILTESELSESGKILPKTPVFFNVLSGNPKFQNKFKIETFAMSHKPVGGPGIPISEVLNSKNGFLDENGSMTIEYGFHFDAIFDEDQEMWKFNLESKLFDCELKKNMITFEKGEKMLYFSLYIRIL
ncbi:Protein CBG24532, partial [Caenorhabditis briggsae]